MKDVIKREREKKKEEKSTYSVNNFKVRNKPLFFNYSFVIRFVSHITTTIWKKLSTKRTFNEMMLKFAHL